MQTRASKFAPPAASESELMRNASITVSKTLSSARPRESGDPGPQTGVPALASLARGTKPWIPALRERAEFCCAVGNVSFRTDALPIDRLACAQTEVRLFYAFFRSSAAGLRLRVRGVTSTSVACVMNSAADVPRGLS